MGLPERTHSGWHESGESVGGATVTLDISQTQVDPNDARMFFRIGNYGSLSTLLKGALDRLAHTGQRYSEYHWVTLDQELVGVLTS